jgi:hypothetical protein
MGAFEYLSVLISIILALGMTRVLAGVGEMLQARSHRRIYWVHAIWIINLFLYLVIAWRIFYRWRNQQPWTFLLFIFVTYLPNYLVFGIAFTLSTGKRRRPCNWITRRTITRTIARSSFFSGYLRQVDIVDSLLKGVPHFLALGPAYFASGPALFRGFGHCCDHTQRALS